MTGLMIKSTIKSETGYLSCPSTHGRQTEWRLNWRLLGEYPIHLSSDGWKFNQDVELAGWILSPGFGQWGGIC